MKRFSDMTIRERGRWMIDTDTPAINPFDDFFIPHGPLFDPPRIG